MKRQRKVREVDVRERQGKHSALTETTSPASDLCSTSFPAQEVAFCWSVCRQCLDMLDSAYDQSLNPDSRRQLQRPDIQSTPSPSYRRSSGCTAVFQDDHLADEMYECAPVIMALPTEAMHLTPLLVCGEIRRTFSCLDSRPGDSPRHVDPRASRVGGLRKTYKNTDLSSLLSALLRSRDHQDLLLSTKRAAPAYLRLSRRIGLYAYIPEQCRPVWFLTLQGNIMDSPTTGDVIVSSRT